MNKKAITEFWEELKLNIALNIVGMLILALPTIIILFILWLNDLTIVSTN